MIVVPGQVVHAEQDADDAAHVVALLAAGQAAAEHQVVDVGRVERGHLVQGGADDGGGQVVGAEVLERPLERAADGGAGGRDDDGFGHGSSTMRRVRRAVGGRRVASETTPAVGPAPRAARRRVRPSADGGGLRRLLRLLGRREVRRPAAAQQRPRAARAGVGAAHLGRLDLGAGAAGGPGRRLGDRADGAAADRRGRCGRRRPARRRRRRRPTAAGRRRPGRSRAALGWNSSTLNMLRSEANAGPRTDPSDTVRPPASTTAMVCAAAISRLHRRAKERSGWRDRPDRAEVGAGADDDLAAGLGQPAARRRRGGAPTPPAGCGW